MAVNLLEEDRLVYHDEDGDTLVIELDSYQQLIFTIADCGICNVDRDAVQTLRDSLTCWLETGKLK